MKKITWNRQAQKIEVWETIDGKTFSLRETFAEETVSREVRNSLPASPDETKPNWFTVSKIIEIIKDILGWLQFLR